jgi:two-component system cell cycle sensor histidine kinase PleC
VINLLSNAIKFTPAGGIVTVGAQVGQGGGLEIYVADTGIGMDATQLETAFSPYGQVNSKIAEVHQGTGLGLPIARSMARLQGGDVIAQSAPGHGTRISLVLPENRVVEPTAVPRLLAQSVR